MRINKDWWPEIIYKWTPLRSKKRGRPRRSWGCNIGNIMKLRNFNGDMVLDSEKGRGESDRQTDRQLLSYDLCTDTSMQL